MNVPNDRPLSIDVARRGRAAVLRLVGSAGMYEAERIVKPLTELAEEPVGRMVLDLSELDFIGSAGLAAIVRGYIRVRRNHGEIRLVAPKEEIRDVLERTRLTCILPVYDSVDEALA